MGLADYAREIVSSGFPMIRGLSGRALGAQPDGYLRRIVDRHFEEQGHVVRRPETLRPWMMAYAAATATTASLGEIRSAAAVSGGEEIPAKIAATSSRGTVRCLDNTSNHSSPSRCRCTRIGRSAPAPLAHLRRPTRGRPDRRDKRPKSGSLRSQDDRGRDRRRRATPSVVARAARRWPRGSLRA